MFFLKMQGQPTDGFLPVSLPKPNFPTFSLATRSTKPNTPTKGDPTENLRSKLNRCVRLSTHGREHRATGGGLRYVQTSVETEGAVARAHTRLRAVRDGDACVFVVGGTQATRGAIKPIVHGVI